MAGKVEEKLIKMYRGEHTRDYLSKGKQAEICRIGGSLCESEGNGIMMRSGSHDGKHVEMIASHLGHGQTESCKQAETRFSPTATPVLIQRGVYHDLQRCCFESF